VTSIGSYAFSGCNGLTSVTIPASVASIGEGAFCNCLSLLISVDPANSMYASRDGALFNKSLSILIQGPGAVSSYTIPNGVIEIGNYAFYWSSLTSITIPSGVIKIGDWAFDMCTNLTSIRLPESVVSIGDWAFDMCTNLTSIRLPEGVVSIGEGAFACCDNLCSVNIPYGVSEIKPRTFWGCPKISTMVIPESVSAIGDWAFRGCQSLTSITIPEGVVTIGVLVFSACGQLSTITIPSSMRELGEEAFFNCPNLSSVEILEGLSSIGMGAFSATGLSSIEIPKSVAYIGDAAFWCCTSLEEIKVHPENASYTSFQNCLYTKDFKKLVVGASNLTSYSVPENVVEIGCVAFYGNRHLSSIALSKSVKKIGASAFLGCTALAFIEIPASVAMIENAAFENCRELRSFFFEGEPPATGENSFDSVSVDCVGYYSNVYASEWAAVIQNGKWNGLEMKEYTPLTLPKSVTGETATWLKTLLENAEVLGEVTLAEGVTNETLEQARLLGIMPSVDGTEVVVASTFEVAEVAVDANRVTLSVTIAVEQGALPETFTLGGEVKLMVCQTLGGEWSEITPDPEEIVVTRVDDKTATVSVTYDKDDYNFFKVVVK
jgi:hypothetical protein